MNATLNRLAGLTLAISAMASILTGALATDHFAAVRAPHWILGVIAAAACIPLLAGRGARWFALSGALLALAPAPPAAHALAAPLLLAAGTLAALGHQTAGAAGSLGAAGSPQVLIGSGPALILVQIALGAAYRHQTIGVVWHLGGAMLVAGLLTMVCVILLRRETLSAAARRAASWLVGLLVAQITLGATALILKMMEQNAALPAAAHILTGSAVFVAAVVLARVQRT